MLNNSEKNKRFLSFNNYLKQRFQSKVAKISLNQGLTCPNIDGTLGFGGCTYCSSKGSGDFAGDKTLPIFDQFHSIKQIIDKKWNNAKYIAYFQANTNTYAPIDKLRENFNQALNLPNVVGVSISTRPDCLDDDVLKLLCELNQKTYLVVELGLQTIFDKTADYINRCHSYSDFLKGYQKLRNCGINVCVHIINGLPFETKEMMLQTAYEVSKLDIHMIKIHMLHVLKNTAMQQQLVNDNFHILSLLEYVDIVCDQIELFDKSVVIGRITGDAKPSDLIAPLWSLKKFVVMNEIDKELQRRDSYQGLKYMV